MSISLTSNAAQQTSTQQRAKPLPSARWFNGSFGHSHRDAAVAGFMAAPSIAERQQALAKYYDFRCARDPSQPALRAKRTALLKAITTVGASPSSPPDISESKQNVGETLAMQARLQWRLLRHGYSSQNQMALLELLDRQQSEPQISHPASSASPPPRRKQIYHDLKRDLLDLGLSISFFDAIQTLDLKRKPPKKIATYSYGPHNTQLSQALPSSKQWPQTLKLKPLDESQGGMSLVRYAFDPKISKRGQFPFVFKQVQLGDNPKTNSAFAEMTRKEGQFLIQLNQADTPNIPTLVGVVPDPQKPGFIMKRAPGRPLDALLYEDPEHFLPDQHITIALEVLKPLIDIVEQGHIPLDFDQSQIMVSEEKRKQGTHLTVTLIDHGLVAKAGEIIPIAGKPETFAPEVFPTSSFHSGPKAHEAMVSWMLGIFLIELMTPGGHVSNLNRSPGESWNWRRLKNQRDAAIQDALDNRLGPPLDPNIAALIRNLLQTNPTQRPTLVECEHVLQTALLEMQQQPTP